MNTGLYAACAGLLARTQALDVAAHNLANLNTTGYKAQTPTFRSLLADTDNDASDDPIAAAIGNFGVLGGERTDMAQGTLEHTGSDSDFALQGEAGLPFSPAISACIHATATSMSIARASWSPRTASRSSARKGRS